MLTPVHYPETSAVLPGPQIQQPPANPGELFIWQEPFQPVIRISPRQQGTPDASSSQTQASPTLPVPSPAAYPVVPAASPEDPPSRKLTLFFGFNRLGDFLCTTAVIRGFRKLHPQTRIIYIVQDAPYSRVLEGNPDIDQVIYSKELYLHGEKILSEEWIHSLPLHIEEPVDLYRFNIHEVSRTQPTVFNDHISMGFARVLGILIDSVRPVVTLSQKENAAIRKYVQRPYILLCMHAGSEVVATGGRRVLKDWMFENWLKLAKSLPSLGDFDIISIGGTSDLQVHSRYFRNLYGLPVKIVAALLKQAACVITLESGISHLCHAVDAPMVIIFSKYVSFPWAFPKEAACCRVIHKDPRLISPDEVLSAVESVLAQKKILPPLPVKM